MNELSLFSGGLGGVLGTHYLLGWKQIGYVEIDNYCQKIIAQRIKDGVIPEAPIFGDIRAFISEGYAKSYQGLVDVITAGFPCQPFSVAGKQQGENDPRNMWPETIECIRIIRPQFALMENVPGLLVHSYARRIFGDLAESGYDARWRVLSAAEVGAPHKRDRLWIVADSSMADTANTRLEREKPKSESRQYNGLSAECSWWQSEPNVGRVAHGVANRVDRLKAIGNGQVPAVVAASLRLLYES